MPRATGQPDLEDGSLSELKRSELQALAKTYGVKANGKNQIIIKSLLANKAFVDSRKENIAESSKSSASTSVRFSPNTTKSLGESIGRPLLCPHANNLWTMSQFWTIFQTSEQRETEISSQQSKTRERSGVSWQL
ncbi:hypothetical protein BYT27DRAFT_6630064 [Phlegmacium glaucopus]|nr:hypothetical protein BYT27DRAFT_6630064 [Phlegmacium glaucopus]